MRPDETTVLFFGTFDEAMHPRVRVLAEALSDAGHHVVRCNAPSGVSTRARVGVFRRPWTAPAVVFRFARAWARLIAAARRTGAVDVVVVGYLGVFDVHLARRLFSQPILLDQMAPLGGIARDRDLPLARVFDALDRWSAAVADVVLVDTEEHRPPHDSPASTKTEVVSVGAPEAWFTAAVDAESRSDGEPLRVCFFGLYTPLQGTAIIAEAIAQLSDRADISWTLIGDGQDRHLAESIIGKNDSVRWIDWLDRDRLPSSVAEHDVCLGIFGTTPKAMRVVPNKVFQGAAAGCAIVTSDTKPQRAALDGAGVLVPPGDATALAAVIADLADQPDLLANKKREASTIANEAFSPSAMSRQLDAIVRRTTRESDDERQSPQPEL